MTKKMKKTKPPTRAKVTTKKKAAPRVKGVAKKKTLVKAPTKKPVKTASKKPATQRKRVPAKRKGNIFEGATEISLTENKIAVTRSMANSSKGGYSESTVRTYHEKTPANMHAFKEAIIRGGMKKITVKMK